MKYCCIECFKTLKNASEFVLHKQKHCNKQESHNLDSAQMELHATMILQAEKTYYYADLLVIGKFYHEADRDILIERVKQILYPPLPLLPNLISNEKHLFDDVSIDLTGFHSNFAKNPRSYFNRTY